MGSLGQAPVWGASEPGGRECLDLHRNQARPSGLKLRTEEHGNSPLLQTSRGHGLHSTQLLSGDRCETDAGRPRLAQRFPSGAEVLARAKWNFAAKNRGGRVWEAGAVSAFAGQSSAGLPLTETERSEFLEQALHELLTERARRPGLKEATRRAHQAGSGEVRV